MAASAQTATNHVNTLQCAGFIKTLDVEHHFFLSAGPIFAGPAARVTFRDPMRLAGFLLLLAGWIIALTAIILLPSPVARGSFLLAGIAVEAIGLVLVFRSHRPVVERHRAGAAFGDSENAPWPAAPGSVVPRGSQREEGR